MLLQHPLYYDWNFLPFVDSFAKFRKATITFVMSVCPSVRMEQLGFRLTDFYEVWYLCIFWKYVEKKIDLTVLRGSTREDLRTFVLIFHWILLRMRNISGRNCRENQNTHFTFSNSFFRKSCRLWDNVEEHGRARQATDDNMAHAFRMLDINPYPANVEYRVSF
jgi:hypothetical protein